MKCQQLNNMQQKIHIIPGNIDSSELELKENAVVSISMETPQPKRKVFKRKPATEGIVQTAFKGDFTPELLPVPVIPEPVPVPVPEPEPVMPEPIAVPIAPVLTSDQELEIYKKLQREKSKKQREEAKNKRTPEEQEAYLKQKREENAVYRKLNPEKIKEKDKKFQEKNHEIILEKKANWREINRATINEKNRIFMAKKRALEKPAKDAAKAKENAIKEISARNDLTIEQKVELLKEYL